MTETATTDGGSSVGTYSSSSKETDDGSTTGVSASDVTKTRTTPTTVLEDATTEETIIDPSFKNKPPPPSHIDYLPGSYNPTQKVPKKRDERVASETSEIIALVIGIIAGALIAVILVILVILKFTSRGDRSYKVDDGKGFQQGPSAALLGNTSSNGQTQYQVNGALRNGDKGQLQKSKKRDSKDIKEWYV